MIDYIESLRTQFNRQIRLQERRPGINQLIVPLFHEDGDMVDIFLEQSPLGADMVRVCDHGMTLMRLSYTFEIDTANKERIFQRIISENGVSYEAGNLFVDAHTGALYPAIMQFAQTVSKVANMELYKREVLHSLFYEMMTEFIEQNFVRFHPKPSFLPIPDRDDLEVDFLLDIKPKSIFIFGVRDSAKARLVTISCLEFLRTATPFHSIIVHEDFDELNKKDRRRLTNAVDKQFTSLADFQAKGIQYIEREAA